MSTEGTASFLRKREDELNTEMWAILENQKDVPLVNLELVLDAGASVKSGSALYTLLVSRHRREDMIKLLISRGATARNIEEEQLMFHRHIQFSNPKLLQCLFENNIFENLEANDFARELAIFATSCLPGDVEMARVCITRALAVGKNIDEVMSTIDEDGFSDGVAKDGDNLLHVVIRGSGPRYVVEQNYGVRPEMIKEFIMYGCDIMQKNDDGNTPEQFAILMDKKWYRTEDTFAMIPILIEERLRLERIEEQRQIAFCMGNHPRLSRDQWMREFDEHLFHMVWRAHAESDR